MIGHQTRPTSLTRREKQLVNCLAEGLVLKECAALMGITPGTVKVYSSRLGDKLGVSGARGIALWELRRRIRALEDELAPHRLAQCIPGAD